MNTDDPILCCVHFAETGTHAINCPMRPYVRPPDNADIYKQGWRDALVSVYGPDATPPGVALRSDGDLYELTFDNLSAMSREDLEAHYRMAMLNWRNAQQERDNLAAARTGQDR